ncbi:winged helix-turn-helix transcriptional regulator [Nocardia sp. CA2R105]|uniref:winged helix-turn-helix transcriptional regulator n=1 Tax=Nocardia coffeae TaxID=2873381 RepID=UPI001CA71D08|nr:winged helix-turn-helix transcriptional regulator [Nocardia coffeae]MBY8864014.1 winged helix-turn-helix transcriptional regulator [Nocardia coffeae]
MRRGGRRCRLHGPQRFGQLHLAEGVTEKMLIGALKDLEADRIVVRRDFQEVPPHVEADRSFSVAA